MNTEILHLEDTGEFFADFIDHVTDYLTQNGISTEDASKIAVDTAVRLSETFSGEKLYISRRPQILARHLAMYNDLKYMTDRDVDKKYNVSGGYSKKVAKKIEAKRQHRRNLRNGKS